MTDLGHTFVVEIDPDMELGTVMVLLEAEVNFNSRPVCFSDLELLIRYSPQYLSANKAYLMKGEI